MTENTEYQNRLYNAAEAFYYAGILTSLPFDASKVDANKYRNPSSTAEAAIASNNRDNHLGAPPIVNFGFSIELYLKLLIYLYGGGKSRGHHLLKLFQNLEKHAPNVARDLIQNHFYSRGCRKDFVETLRAEATVFQDWRYAHEKEFLCSSSDTLLMLASACRETVQTNAGGLRSNFTAGRVP